MVGSPGTPGLEGQVQNLQPPAPGCENQWPGLHWGVCCVAIQRDSWLPAPGSHALAKYTRMNTFAKDTGNLQGSERNG